MRRAAHRRVGLEVDVSIGQPPFEHSVEGQPVEYRIFLCDIMGGEAAPVDYEEVRWVRPAQLCEYDFAAPIDRVIEWYRTV